MKPQSVAQSFSGTQRGMGEGCSAERVVMKETDKRGNYPLQHFVRLSRLPLTKAHTTCSFCPNNVPRLPELHVVNARESPKILRRSASYRKTQNLGMLYFKWLCLCCLLKGYKKCPKTVFFDHFWAGVSEARLSVLSGNIYSLSLRAARIFVI